jgi:hypothetical protein
MHHSVNLVVSQQLCHESGVTDIALDKAVARIPLKRGQVFQIAGVGKAIKVENRAVRIVGHERMNKIGADKTGPAGNEDRLGSKWHLSSSFPDNTLLCGLFSFLGCSGMVAQKFSGRPGTKE